MALSENIPYYIKAFSEEVKELWKGFEFVQKYEIPNLCYYKALNCFDAKDDKAINDRRVLLFKYLEKEFKSDSDDCTLIRYKDTLPIRTILNRVVRNLCTAYNEAPNRSFGGGTSEDVLLKLYSDGNINTILKDAYYSAYMCGMVALRPIFRNDELRVIVFKPHEFRIIASPDDYLTPQQFIHLDADYDGNIRYINWTDLNIYTHNIDGDIIKTEPNPYGKIPFVFFSLDNTNKFYKSGQFDLIEEQLKLNKLAFLSDLDVAYNGLPIKIATNMDSQAFDLAPDKIISINNVVVGDSQLAPPNIEFVNPVPQYDSIESFKDTREQSLYKSLGFPASMLGEATGAISGVARIIERQEIIEKRYSDLPYLTKFEKEFAKLVTIVANNDAKLNLPLDFDFSIDFGEERVYLEPDAEYEFDKKKMNDGILSPIDFYVKWGGLDKTTNEEDVIKTITARKELLSKLSFTPAANVLAPNNVVPVNA